MTEADADVQAQILKAHKEAVVILTRRAEQASLARSWGTRGASVESCWTATLS